MKNKVVRILPTGISIKIFSLVLVVSMILTAIPVLSASEPSEGSTKTVNMQYIFSAPTVTTNKEGYVAFDIDGASESTLTAGAPMLPKQTERCELALGSIIESVTYTTSSSQTIMFEGIAAPGPIPQLLAADEYPLMTKIAGLFTNLLSRSSSSRYEKPITNSVAALDEGIYESHDSYGTTFAYEVFIGRNTTDDTLKTYVVYTMMPMTFSDVSDNFVTYYTNMDIEITYREPPASLPLDEEDSYDLLILAPSAYLSDLAPLVEHKEDMGLATKLVCLDEIYDESYFDISEDFSRDIQEKIKYFIYNATLNWQVKYVLAVGGWRTLLGFNVPNKQFPIRYSHNVDGEPGYVADQYYSCFLKYDPVHGYVFDSMDSNQNDRFLEWDFQGWDSYDPYPDTYFGRLACRSNREVKTMVDKIITYETTTYGSEWFNRSLFVSGDGFQDADDLAVDWDTSSLPNGQYTISAQTLRIHPLPPTWGPVDEVVVNIDHTAPSRIVFGDESHLKIQPLTDEQSSMYPAKLVAEIVVPSDENIIGNTDVNYMPDPKVEAYCTDYSSWGNVDYNKTTGIMKIRSKSYDPAPHVYAGNGDPYVNLQYAPTGQGSHTKVKIWVNNSAGVEVFDSGYIYSNMYYEGEIEDAQAMYYLGSDFEKKTAWASNGTFENMWDVLNAFSEGYGIVYVNGHSSCMVYGDHFPGVPGGRHNGQVNGWASINLKFGLERYQADEGDPLFPLDQLTNGNKLPVLLYSGCHSGQFDTSLVSIFSDPYNVLFGDRYGTWVPEGVAWWITRLPQGGSIATIGNTGLGSGYLGEAILMGLTGWLFPTVVYNYKDANLDSMLGKIHTKTLTDYSTKENPIIVDQTARKHFEQFNLLGDPSLKIGGYPPETGTLDTPKDSDIEQETEPRSLSFTTLTGEDSVISLSPILKVTKNTYPDTSPQAMASTNEDKFVVGYKYENAIGEIHPGFAYSSGGGSWTEMIWANPGDWGYTSLYTWEDDEGEQYTVGSVPLDPAVIGVFYLADVTNPNSWVFIGYRWIITGGQDGLAVTGYFDGDNMDYGGVWTEGSTATIYFGNYVNEGGRYTISYPITHPEADCDESTGWHYFVGEKRDSNGGFIVAGKPPSSFVQKIITEEFVNPDVVAADGLAYVVSENSGSIECRVSSNNGVSWTMYEVTNDGFNPRVVIADDGSVECYFSRGDNVYTTASTNHGVSWTGPIMISGVEMDSSMYSPFVATKDGLVFAKDDGDLYANIFTSTIGAMIGDISFAQNGQGIYSSITNSGTENLDYFDWTIQVIGDSPLGTFFGGGPLISMLLKGRVLNGGATSEHVINLKSGKVLEIGSSPVFGFGHVLITARVSRSDTILAEKSKDAFLLGGRIILDYPEE